MKEQARADDDCGEPEEGGEAMPVDRWFASDRGWRFADDGEFGVDDAGLSHGRKLSTFPEGEDR
jgi:hypothetical protein